MKFFATNSEYLCETNLGYDSQFEKQWCKLKTYNIQGLLLSLDYPPLIKRHRCCVATGKGAHPAVLSPAHPRVEKLSVLLIVNT